MNEPKCFAEAADRGKCGVLTLSKCQGHENCSMFKTEEQAKLDQQKAFDRIAKLPDEEQKRISQTHYNGKTPWHHQKKDE